MKLNNYGKIWHLDHVKPCASFDLSKAIPVPKKMVRRIVK